MGYINIGKNKIGSGKPAYIVAEIGINHNGDMNLAKETILAAKYAGANAVKFQNYRTEDFILNKSVIFEYKSQGNIIKESQYSMFKRYELSENQLVELKKFCDVNEIELHATPTSFDGVDLLRKVGVLVLKNGSDYLTNLELIKYMGKSMLPTVISTGMSLISEIDEAVRAFRETGNDKLILLHCTSCYPTPPQEVHLNKIKSMQKVFGCNVGFSDHTKHCWAAVSAVAHGVCWFEKHFTLNKDLSGPDHTFSLDPNEFTSYVEGIRYAEKAQGTFVLGPSKLEQDSRNKFRLSCAARRDIKKGDIIYDSDIVFVRPGTAIPPKDKGYIIGKSANKDIKIGEIINIIDLS